MTAHVRRYVFLDYLTLQQIKFKKLEKVSDKVFVFVGSNEENIPFELVKEAQRMGNNLKWIEASGSAQHDLNYHICFLMGKLHEKIGSDIEFAILSNDTAFDPLVNFINSTGRSCIRVKQQGGDLPKSEAPPQYVESPENENLIKSIAREQTEPADSVTTLFGNRRSESSAALEGVSNPSFIDETARETVRRLIRSGNRPTDLHLLKNYILLHNQEVSTQGNVEKVINLLQANNEIKVRNEEVIYNF